ncbi:MAG: tRNA glutamyl-Q(34) synthetase GluQRS [Sulfuriflexus sp.]|nr:tRNA glutamyl-Q(34) synthetase GluQRS [Sulfuriflexus sp.]
MNTKYRGRFAPSPTGPLHFGSLLAAISSYAQARQQQGQWLVRIEDVDLPRCDPDSTKLILKALESYGLYWDEEIVYQSQRDKYYKVALDVLNTQNDTYGCACTRKEIIKAIAANDTASVYPGTCSNGIAKGKTARSIRMRANNSKMSFNDAVQGEFSQHLAKDVGDFIIRRSDGLFAYQLAVVVDDALQNITDVVRGSDMLDSTPRQIYLQQHLNYATPNYMHIPLATHSDGHKLSKQTMAPAITLDDPRPTLIKALNFLGQQAPHELRDTNIETIWGWVIQNWSAENIPATLSLPYNDASE